MKNATRRICRAAKRAGAELHGLGTADKPVVLTKANAVLFITAVAGAVFQNPKRAKYRAAQKRRKT